MKCVMQKLWHSQIKGHRKPSASQSVFNKIHFRLLIKESLTWDYIFVIKWESFNSLLKILTSPWRSHGCPQHLLFVYKGLQGLMHQRQTLKTKKAKPDQDHMCYFKSLT